MAEVEVWRGGVATRGCDQMGHLNVGFYVAESMQALAGLAAELGLPRAFAPPAGGALRPARKTTGRTAPHGACAVA